MSDQPSGKKTPIRLYYWPTPNGMKVSIMLEECGLPYKVNYVDITSGEQFKPAFLKVSPNNRIPAIVDPDGPGGKPLSLFESGAILQYLGRKTRKYYPADPAKRTEVEQWLMWQMGGVGPMAGQAHHFMLYAPSSFPYSKKRYRDEVSRLYGVLDQQLVDRDYVAGNYSIADIALWPWVNRWERQEQDIAKFPRVVEWLERVGERPAVKRGAAVGKNRQPKQPGTVPDKPSQPIAVSTKPKPARKPAVKPSAKSGSASKPAATASSKAGKSTSTKSGTQAKAPAKPRPPSKPSASKPAGAATSKPSKSRPSRPSRSAQASAKPKLSKKPASRPSAESAQTAAPPKQTS